MPWNNKSQFKKNNRNKSARVRSKAGKSDKYICKDTTSLTKKP